MPAQAALEDLQQQQWNDYIPSIVLMTDGQSNEGSFEELKKTFESLGKDIPIFSITFGDADVTQLDAISKMTHSRVFDGGADLIQAFKQAKGYT
jgi:Ca-activated chloride channel family protein